MKHRAQLCASLRRWRTSVTQCMRIPITAKLSADSPFHPFLLCLCSRILCPDYRAEQTCEACSLQCEPCGLSGLQAPNAIIPLLAWSPRQGKCALLKASKPFPPLLIPPVIFKLYLSSFPLWHRRLCKCIQHTPTSQTRASLSSLHYSTCF